MRIRSRIRIQPNILIRIQIQIRGGGTAKNVHPPWQNPRNAPARHPGRSLPWATVLRRTERSPALKRSSDEESPQFNLQTIKNPLNLKSVIFFANLDVPESVWIAQGKKAFKRGLRQTKYLGDKVNASEEVTK